MIPIPPELLARGAELSGITAPKSFFGKMGAGGGWGSILSGVASGVKSGLEGITGNKFSGGADALHDRKMQEAMRKDDIKTMIRIRDEQFMQNYKINKSTPPRIQRTVKEMSPQNYSRSTSNRLTFNQG